MLGFTPQDPKVRTGLPLLVARFVEDCPMKRRCVLASLLWLLFSTPVVFAQSAREGIWEGYEGAGRVNRY